ncbi:aldo/keto reductase [Kribbella sancticallisti]|uniref:Aldo/keto reductase n=2 Tax=Kribbella sancticallisti TaxID=460087 RepID=A0ABP4PWU2_9ACTN
MVHASVAAGVRLFDTADVYGTGQSERVLGRALAQLPAGVRDEVVVATKFANLFDETTRTAGGQDVSPAGIRRACENSLKRLGVDSIDLYQLHGGAATAAEAEPVVEALEQLVSDGLIRAFGTSVDAPEVISVFAASPNAHTVQTQANVFGHNDAVLDVARRNELAVLVRSPLAMGLLTGKYDLTNRPPADDVRRDTPWWTYFDDDAMETWLQRLDSVREILTLDGRTLAQGCLSYLWALDPAIIPLPGARTVSQAEENAGALTFGPLPDTAVKEILTLLADSPERH